LAAQARQRGVSVSALVTDLAAQAERHAIFKAERDAEQAEASDATVRDEARDWGDTTDDGIA